jgi:hypothetical protein
MGVWSTTEQAIFNWVSAAIPAGPPTYSVIFAEQQGSVFEGPFITIRLGDPIALGCVDDPTYTSNTNPAPNDVTFQVAGVREFGVTLQAFAGRGQVTGDYSPRAVLSAVRQNLEFPSVRYTLQHFAGLSPFDDRGPVRNVATEKGTIFEPRSVWECRFYVNEVATMTTTEILTVDSGFVSPGPQDPVPGIVTLPGGSTVKVPNPWPST